MQINLEFNGQDAEYIDKLKETDWITVKIQPKSGFKTLTKIEAPVDCPHCNGTGVVNGLITAKVSVDDQKDKLVYEVRKFLATNPDSNGTHIDSDGLFPGRAKTQKDYDEENKQKLQNQKLADEYNAMTTEQKLMHDLQSAKDWAKFLPEGSLDLLIISSEKALSDYLANKA